MRILRAFLRAGVHNLLNAYRTKCATDTPPDRVHSARPLIDSGGGCIHRVHSPHFVPDASECTGSILNEMHLKCAQMHGNAHKT